MAKKAYVRNSENTAWVELASATTDLSDYLTHSSASSTYLTQLSASNTYLTQTSASTIYQPKVANISDTEIGYLNNVSSNIQTQLNNKHTSGSPISMGTNDIQFSATGGGTVYLNGPTGTVDGNLDLELPVISTGNEILVADTTTQTLTNKTLSSPVFSGTASGDMSTTGWVGGVTSAAAGRGLLVRQPSGDGSSAILQFTNNAVSAQKASISADTAGNLTFSPASGAGTFSGTLATSAIYSSGVVHSGGHDSGSLASVQPGAYLGPSTSGSSYSMFGNAGTVAYFQRLGSDGTVMGFYRDSTGQGSISISGTTVAYNAFSGGHWTQLANQERIEILPGTVLENIDEMCEWWNEDGSLQANDQLAKVKISDTLESKAVYGVFQRWDDEEDGLDDILAISLGSWLCRVQAGEVLEVGDLLDSAGNGCAKVQSDDIIRSRTIGKVTSTIPFTVYEDGSFVVPVTLHCG